MGGREGGEAGDEGVEDSAVREETEGGGGEREEEECTDKWPHGSVSITPKPSTATAASMVQKMSTSWRQLSSAGARPGGKQ